MAGVSDLGKGAVLQGGLIRLARRKAGLTLVQAGAALGVSITFLSDVERGQRLLAPGRLAELARLFGCAVSELGGPRHVDRDLALWLRERPDVMAVLVEAQRSSLGVQLAGVTVNLTLDQADEAHNALATVLRSCERFLKGPAADNVTALDRDGVVALRAGLVDTIDAICAQRRAIQRAKESRDG